MRSLAETAAGLFGDARNFRMVSVEGSTQNAELAEATSLATTIANKRQNRLFEEPQGIKRWDLDAAVEAAVTCADPLEIRQQVIAAGDFSHISRIRASSLAIRSGDMLVGETVNNLSRLSEYHRAVQKPLRTAFTGAVAWFYESLGWGSPTLTDVINNFAKDQLLRIEGGLDPDYNEAFNVAFALKYYQNVARLGNQVRGSLEQLVLQHRILAGCRVVGDRNFSALYGLATLAGVVDESDETHQQSAAFTRAVMGANANGTKDQVDSILQAVGHGAGVRFLADMDTQVRSKTQFGDVIRLRDRKGAKATSQARFMLRFNGIIDATRRVFAATDNLFSLTAGGTRDSRYGNLRRGDLLLDPSVVYQVLGSEARQQVVVEYLIQHGKIIPAQLDVKAMIKDGAPRVAMRRLGALYTGLNDFGRAVIMASLVACGECMYPPGSIDYKAALSGKVPSPKTLIRDLVGGFDEAAS